MPTYIPRALPPPSQLNSDIEATYVDLSKSVLSASYPNPTFVLILDNVFTKEECEEFLAIAVTSARGKWDPASISVGRKQVVALEERNCGRIIYDDQKLADKLLERIRPWISELEVLGGRRAMKNLTDLTTPDGTVMAIQGDQGGREDGWVGIIGNRGIGGRKWKMVRLNERLRFLKYGSGSYFRPHYDGEFSTWQTREALRSNKASMGPEERSFITYQLYLNNDEGLVGGATRIHSQNLKDGIDIEAKQGRVLLFQHRDILHSGEDVLQGLKYTVRSDILYTKVEEPERNNEAWRR